MERQTSPSDFLAAERTFLAWIRTGLALAGFGFVIARFGLFLEAMQAGQGGSRSGQSVSPWFGALLILAGAIALACSAWNYTRLIRRLKRGETAPSEGSPLAVALALGLAIVALALAIHLVVVSSAAVQPIRGASMSSTNMSTNNGIVSLPAHRTVEQTVQRLEEILAAKGVKLFTVIDHSGEAEKAGFKMLPCKLMIFGNPKAGTPLMLAAPSAALDLPLKILIWERADRTVWVTYNDSAYLQHRHALPEELMANIAAIDGLAAKAAE